MVSEALNSADFFDKAERKSIRSRLAERLVIVVRYRIKHSEKSAHLSHLLQLSCGESLGYPGALSVDKSQRALVLVCEERTGGARSAFCSLACKNSILAQWNDEHDRGYLKSWPS